MRKLESIQKVVEQQQKKCQLQLTQIQQKINEEQKKLTILQSCLDEYHTFLKNDTTLSGFELKQYHLFIERLENAIFLQSQIIDNWKRHHESLLTTWFQTQKKSDYLHEIEEQKKKNAPEQ